MTGGRRALLVARLGCVLVALGATCAHYLARLPGRPTVLALSLCVAGAMAVTGLTRGRGPVSTTGVQACGFVSLAVGVVAMVDNVWTGGVLHGLPTVATHLCRGLTRGWAALLVPGQPELSPGELLATPMLLTWLTARATTSAIARPTSPLAPAVPLVLNELVALALAAGPTGGSPTGTGCLLGGVVTLVALGTAQQDLGWHASPALVRSRLLDGVPSVVVVVLAGVATAGTTPLATGERRLDPSTLLPRRVEANELLSPLATLKRQLVERPGRPLFTVRLSGPGAERVDRVLLASLDTFDGSLWTSSDSFPTRGRDLPPDPAMVGGDEIRAEIAITDLDGPYLPTVGWPLVVDRAGYGFDDVSGVLVTRRSDPRGLRYELVATTRPADGHLSEAPLVRAGDDRYLALPPGLPAVMSVLAKQLTVGETGVVAQLRAIETYLRALPYGLDVPPGHSWDAMNRLLAADPGSAVGYSEQRATAFALLSRAAGIPSRVAVGYRLFRGAATGTTHQVTTTDVHAWPEVRLRGYGWVPFEPTDDTMAVTGEVAPQPAVPQSLAGDLADLPGPAEAEAVSPQDASSADAPDRGNDVLPFAVRLAAAIPGGLVLAVCLVAGEKARRRRTRRRAGGNARKVLGAWQEAADRLSEYGVRTSPALTVTETARLARQRLGPAAGAAGDLAVLANAAVFRPAGATDLEALRAWELAERLRSDLRQARGRTSAMLALVDPRSLTRDRRVRPGPHDGFPAALRER